VSDPGAICVGPEFGFGAIGELVLDNAQPGAWPYLCGPSAASDLHQDPDSGLWVPPREVTPYGGSKSQNPTTTLTLSAYTAAVSGAPTYTVANPSDCFPMQAIVGTEITLRFVISTPHVMIKVSAWLGPTDVTAPDPATLPVLKTVHELWTGQPGDDSVTVNLARRVGVPAGGSVTLQVLAYLYAQANPGSSGVTAPELDQYSATFFSHGWPLTSGQLPITDIGSLSAPVASTSGYALTGTVSPSRAASFNGAQVTALFETAAGAVQALVYDPSGLWTAVAVGGAPASQPQVATTTAGGFHGFWEGTDGTIWHSYSGDYGRTWSAPASLGAATGGPPQAVGHPTGVVQVFYTGTGGALWAVVYSPSTGWGAPVDLGGTVAPGTVPTAAISIAGVTDVLYLRTDGYLGHVYSADYGVTWSGLSQVTPYLVSAQPMATGHVQSLEVVNFFWRGADGSLWGATKTNLTGWPASARSYGGSIAAGTVPVPVLTADDTTWVFYQSADNNLWCVRSNDYGAFFSAPIGLGSGPVGQPYAAGQSTGIIDVFWRGQADGNVYHLRYSPADGWDSSAQNLGGPSA
jgi:hypothetical protein